MLLARDFPAAEWFPESLGKLEKIFEIDDTVRIEIDSGIKPQSSLFFAIALGQQQKVGKTDFTVSIKVGRWGRDHHWI